jgi:hypothetical protein
MALHEPRCAEYLFHPLRLSHLRVALEQGSIDACGNCAQRHSRDAEAEKS